MVAFATVKEFFTPSRTNDQVAEVVNRIIKLPNDAKLYTNAPTQRQWVYLQSPSYNGFFNFEIREKSPEFYGYKENELIIALIGNWHGYADGLEEREKRFKMEDFRTSKELVEAACNWFAGRYQKPESRGNVQVFYDESKFIWCWKRPNSDSFVRNALGEAFHKNTCLSVTQVHGGGDIRDEYMILSRTEHSQINSNSHPIITILAGIYYFKAALTPIYRNEVPFETVYTYVPNHQATGYEFVVVNGERRYLNLKRAENSLLAFPIHSYSTRIEGLVPKDKLFLTGKTDLYAKRDKDEIPFLGWELEAASNKSEVGTEASAQAFKEQLPWLVMCKHDGSISPEGFETVSVPATLDFWQESNLSSALDSMRVSPHNMRSFEHVKCGFHVHVSRSALSVLDLQKLERFVHNPDNNSFITKVAGRGAGTYQKYIPSLFNDRKNVATKKSDSSLSGRIIVEDLQYFVSKWESAVRLAREWQGMMGGENTPKRRLKILFDYISNYMSHDYLDRRIRDRSELMNERYPNWINYSISDYYADVRRSSTPLIYLPDICGTDDEAAHLEFFKFLFGTVVGEGRPKFCSIVNKFFPEWELNTTEIPPLANHEWKAGIRKSLAPAGRKFSQAAAKVVKGPVGKGAMSRYDALNTVNKNTVEFRMFKGTMNGTTIMRYLEFVDALVRFVANTNATDAGLSYKAFIAWLKSDAFNVARYEHLVSFISTAGFIERKDIRRKTLPEVVSEDSSVTGIVASVAKGFEAGLEQKPIGTFIGNFATEEAMASAVVYNEEENRTTVEEAPSVSNAEFSAMLANITPVPAVPTQSSGVCSDPTCQLCNPSN